MVWYHAEGLEPYWDLPDIDGLPDGKFTYCGRSEHYISSHIQVREHAVPSYTVKIWMR